MWELHYGDRENHLPVEFALNYLCKSKDYKFDHKRFSIDTNNDDNDKLVKKLKDMAQCSGRFKGEVRVRCDMQEGAVAHLF